MIDDQKFGIENRAALLLNSISADDYVASRCCFLNGLIAQGYILGEQALEKILKSAILLVDTKANIRDRKQFGFHNIEQLFIQLGSRTNIDCLRFRNMAKSLTEAYELLRHPDNKVQTPGKSYHFKSGFITEIDEAYLYVAEILRIPDQIKFRTGIFRILFMSTFERTQYWLKQNNPNLESKLSFWNAEFTRFNH